MGAGWRYVANEDGTPRDEKFGVGNTIEDSADVVDILREFFGMIWWLAYDSTLSREEILEKIDDARAYSYNGLSFANEGVMPKLTPVMMVKNYLLDLGVSDIQANAFIINMIDKGIIDPTKKVENG